MRRAATGALVGVTVALLGLSLGPSASAAPVHGRAPIATTSYFVFYSDFETNLNDALINAGVARRFDRSELFRAGDEAACFAKLEPAARAGWNRALDYYAEIVSPTRFNDRGQLLIRLQIAGFDDERLDSRDQDLVDITRSVRGAAAPAYRACRWTAQNDANRRWVAATLPALTAHERAVGERLGRLYEKTWRGLPLPVDVVQTVDWSGANTIFRDPDGGHILIAIENDPKSALEVLGGLSRAHRDRLGPLCPGQANRLRRGGGPDRPAAKTLGGSWSKRAQGKGGGAVWPLAGAVARARRGHRGALYLVNGVLSQPTRRKR